MSKKAFTDHLNDTLKSFEDKIKLKDFFKNLDTPETRKIVISISKNSARLAILHIQAETDEEKKQIQNEWELIWGTMNSIRAISEASLKNHIKDILIDLIPTQLDVLKKFFK